MDNLQRLRLKYEDSAGHCAVCGERGMVGVTLKLFDDPEEAGVDAFEPAAPIYLRCANRTVCNERIASAVQ